MDYSKAPEYDTEISRRRELPRDPSSSALRSPGQPAEEYPPRSLHQQLSNLSLTSTPVMHGQGYGQRTVSPEDFKGARTVEIPFMLVPIVMGIHGDNIRKIQRESGVIRVHIHSSSPNDPTGMRMCEIWGNRERTRTAKKMIEDIIHTHDQWSVIKLPQHQVHLIIGPEKRFQRELQTRSGCQIVVGARNSAIDNEREIYLVGTSEVQADAKTLIDQYVAGDNFSDRSEPAATLKTMDIQPEMMQYVIGKGGEVLQGIKNKTGCRIWYDRNFQRNANGTFSDQKIILSGTDLSVAAAACSIEAILKEEKDRIERDARRNAMFFEMSGVRRSHHSRYQRSYNVYETSEHESDIVSRPSIESLSESQNSPPFWSQLTFPSEPVEVRAPVPRQTNIPSYGIAHMEASRRLGSSGTEYWRIRPHGRGWNVPAPRDAVQHRAPGHFPGANIFPSATSGSSETVSSVYHAHNHGYYDRSVVNGGVGSSNYQNPSLLDPLQAPSVAIRQRPQMVDPLQGASVYIPQPTSTGTAHLPFGSSALDKKSQNGGTGFAAGQRAMILGNALRTNMSMNTGGNQARRSDPRRGRGRGARGIDGDALPDVLKGGQKRN